MKAFLSIILILCLNISFSQDIKLLMKEAANADRSLNEESAFDLYKQVIAIDSNNAEALIELSNISLARGIRTSDKKEKEINFSQSLQFAEKAVSGNENNSNASAALSLANQYLADVSSNNKLMAGYFKTAIDAAKKAYELNKENGKAAYTLGHLHFDLIQLPAIKKSMLKNIHKIEFKGDIDSAIFYYEKCKTLLPYYVRNYLELAKAYNFNNQPAPAMDVLSKLIKLPNRTIDDKALKAEGEAILKKML